jgi:hypothetical protein
MPTSNRILVFLLTFATAAGLTALPVAASAPGFLTPFDAAPNNNFGISVATRTRARHTSFRTAGTGGTADLDSFRATGGPETISATRSASRG